MTCLNAKIPRESQRHDYTMSEDEDDERFVLHSGIIGSVDKTLYLHALARARLDRLDHFLSMIAGD